MARSLAVDPEMITRSGVFDAQWYQDTYPDVSGSGFEPLEHYLRFGLAFDRDPGPGISIALYRHTLDPEDLGRAHPLAHYLRAGRPEINPDRVLMAALAIFQQGEPNRALALARQYLPGHLAQTITMLETNAARKADDLAAWERAMNRYLDSYKLAPIALRSGKLFLERLHCGSLPQVTTGPVVSVIMPAWNAEKTLRAAADSILDQTWRPLELIIVDDASTDGSWQVAQQIAASDPRVKLLQNTRNVGPYASKNLGLLHATGTYVTGHDADDWAHPERLARHLAYVRKRPQPMPVSLPYGLRMQADGTFHGARPAGTAKSYDGWMQTTPIGTLFETAFLRDKLGFWDSVRFGADTEILSRARHLLGQGPLEIPLLSMICLDMPDSLSNDREHGARAENGGLSQTRRRYYGSVKDWLLLHPTGASMALSFPPKRSHYQIPPEMRVPIKDIQANIAANPAKQGAGS